MCCGHSEGSESLDVTRSAVAGCLISGLKAREPGNLLILTPRWHLLRGLVSSASKKACTLVVYDAIETDVTKMLPYSCKQIPTDSGALRKGVKS